MNEIIGKLSDAKVQILEVEDLTNNGRILILAGASKPV